MKHHNKNKNKQEGRLFVVWPECCLVSKGEMGPPALSSGSVAHLLQCLLIRPPGGSSCLHSPLRRVKVIIGQHTGPPKPRPTNDLIYKARDPVRVPPVNSKTQLLLGWRNVLIRQSINGILHTLCLCPQRNINLPPRAIRREQVFPGDGYVPEPGQVLKDFPLRHIV